MKICTLKLDKQGRITIPKTFLDANNVQGSRIYMEVINSNSQSVRLTFVAPIYPQDQNHLERG
tara:strand:- start:194 stop:382 length:189 start_codon:yes stop_codon:yes gene_type:complete